jgi:peptidyl-tRNA hydrolase, PTH2 family
MSAKLSETLYNPITVILLGAIAGFVAGRLTAPISTAKHLQATSRESEELTELPKAEEKTREEEPSDEILEDEDSESESELQDFSAFGEECKLVLVVRTDLGMTKGMETALSLLHSATLKLILSCLGKIAAQCSHATLACYKALLKQDTTSENSFSMLKRWEYFGQAKIAVQVKSEEELLTLQAKAMSLGLCAKVIHDAGRTQIASGSATVLGVGPGPKSVIDQVTGGLKLL